MQLKEKLKLFIREVHSVFDGIESLSFLVPKTLELVPDNIKQSKSLKIF